MLTIHPSGLMLPMEAFIWAARKMGGRNVKLIKMAYDLVCVRGSNYLYNTICVPAYPSNCVTQKFWELLRKIVFSTFVSSSQLSISGYAVTQTINCKNNLFIIIISFTITLIFYDFFLFFLSL